EFTRAGTLTEIVDKDAGRRRVRVPGDDVSLFRLAVCGGVRDLCSAENPQAANRAGSTCQLGSRTSRSARTLRFFLHSSHCKTFRKRDGAAERRKLAGEFLLS